MSTPRYTKVHRMARTPPAGNPPDKRPTLCGCYVKLFSPALTTVDAAVTCKTCLRALQGKRGQERAI